MIGSPPVIFGHFDKMLSSICIQVCIFVTLVAAGLAHTSEDAISLDVQSVLRANNLTIKDVRDLGLTSTDLHELGISVRDRIFLLRAGSTAATRAAKSGSGTTTDDDSLVLAQDFAFAATYINSTRQYGKCLHMIVKYRYPQAAIQDQSFPDYRDIYARALWYAQPSEELPMETKWELVNNYFVREIMASYNLAGLSSQIQVMDSQDNPSIFEPGNHGSTVTAGDLGQPPTAEGWVNTFQFDCTKGSQS